MLYLTISLLCFSWDLADYNMFKKICIHSYGFGRANENDLNMLFYRFCVFEKKSMHDK